MNVTPLEPTWEGHLTLEISNTTPLPAKIYGGEGIAQLLFFEGNEEPSVAYAERNGKVPATDWCDAPPHVTWTATYGLMATRVTSKTSTASPGIASPAPAEP